MAVLCAGVFCVWGGGYMDLMDMDMDMDMGLMMMIAIVFWGLHGL